MSRFNSKEDLEHNILVLDEYPLADPRKSIAAFPDALSDDQPDTDSTYTAADSAQESYFDPNYDSNSILGAHHNSLPSSDLIRDPEDDSPYPEVRSAVANFDDPDMPASTIRAWVLGVCWAIILPGMNQFFYFRYPSVAIGGVCPLNSLHAYDALTYECSSSLSYSSSPSAGRGCAYAPTLRFLGSRSTRARSP